MAVQIEEVILSPLIAAYLVLNQTLLPVTQLDSSNNILLTLLVLDLTDHQPGIWEGHQYPLFLKEVGCLAMAGHHRVVLRMTYQ